MEEAPAKRRKLNHSGENNGAATTPTVSLSRSTFVLQTAELLKEEKINYKTELEGIDDLLHKVKASIEGIAAHEPQPVRCSAAA